MFLFLVGLESWGKNYIYSTSQKDCMMFHYFVRSKSTGCLKIRLFLLGIGCQSEGLDLSIGLGHRLKDRRFFQL